VDVFFVISGYLITVLLLKELETGRFSIINFYERRARRLLPALFFLVIMSMPIAWVLLPSADYKDFSQSLVAVSLSASNILFFLESGYFEQASQLKPLLHTWSLAVEQQFYLLFPIFLLVTWKLGRRWRMILVWVALLASLSFAQWAAFAKPSAAFFLLPARIWELLIGVLAGFVLYNRHNFKFRKSTYEIGGLTGLALIVIAILIFDKDTRFSSVYALVPTIGAFLVILFAVPQSTIGRLLSSRYLVHLGLISYGAYLWHFTLFAFARHESENEPSNSFLLVIATTSLVFAHLSWKFIETPFRNRESIKTSLIYKVGLVCIFSFGALGLLGHFQNGFLMKSDLVEINNFKLSNDNFIILGDSHANHLVSGISSVTSGSVKEFSGNGCIPFRNVDRYDFRTTPNECVKKVNSWLDNIKVEDPDATIILSSMGPVYLDATPFRGKDADRVKGMHLKLVDDEKQSDRYKVYEIGLRRTLSELVVLNNPTVVFAYDVPELGIDHGCSPQKKQITVGDFAFSDLVKVADESKCYVPREEFDFRVSSYKNLVANVLIDFPDVVAFDPTDYFCNEKICRGFHPYYGLLYRDFDHLSDSGSRFFAENLVKKIS
jgi:peptidoglycan/LPS O-acetylase OafA/YrhL